MKKLLSILLILVLACSPALADANVVSNPTLMMWAEVYAELLLTSEDADLMNFIGILPSGNITYDVADLRDGVAHGGLVGPGNAYTFGAGAGVTDEDKWYISYTYDQKTPEEYINSNTAMMLLSTLAIGLCAEDDEDEVIDIIMTIFQTLLAYDNVGIEKDGMVIGKKILPNGNVLYMVDSVAYYEAYYYGTFENYFTM